MEKTSTEPKIHSILGSWQERCKKNATGSGGGWGRVGELGLGKCFANYESNETEEEEEEKLKGSSENRGW